MEIELFAFVFCEKNLCPYLLAKLFTVRTDHKNLVYLANLTVPKLVICRPSFRSSVFRSSTSLALKTQEFSN